MAEVGVSEYLVRRLVAVYYAHLRLKYQTSTLTVKVETTGFVYPNHNNI